jgi:hypothetical protein
MDKDTNLGQIFDTCWGKFQQNLQKDLVPNCIIGYQRIIAHNKKKDSIYNTLHTIAHSKEDSIYNMLAARLPMVYLERSLGQMTGDE